MHNGLMKAFATPPLDRLLKIPRREAIKELGKKHPPLSVKCALISFGPILWKCLNHSTFRERAKLRKASNKGASVDSNVKLCVLVDSARKLSAKDSNGTFFVYPMTR